MISMTYRFGLNVEQQIQMEKLIRWCRAQSTGELSFKLDSFPKRKQARLWPYEAPGIVRSGLYDLTIVCGPKDVSLEKMF